MSKKKVEIVISNSIKHDVISVYGTLLEFSYGNYITILLDNDFELVETAINLKNGLEIEMFFITGYDYPVFGSNYEYELHDNKLCGKKKSKH